MPRVHGRSRVTTRLRPGLSLALLAASGAVGSLVGPGTASAEAKEAAGGPPVVPVALGTPVPPVREPSTVVGGGDSADAREPAWAQQRQLEAENLRRQDLAALLAYWGVPVDWHQHPAAELADWRDRIAAAAALRNAFAVSVDWQSTSLAELTDMRLRAAKSAEIAATQGIKIDWLRYSWAELEDLRRHVEHLTAARGGTQPEVAAQVGVRAAARRDELAVPALDPAAAKPEGPARPVIAGSPAAPAHGIAQATSAHPASSERETQRDPDEIMAPTFGPKSTAGSSTKISPPGAAKAGATIGGPQDPDAILPPDFARFANRANFAPPPGRPPRAPAVDRRPPATTPAADPAAVAVPREKK